MLGRQLQGIDSEDDVDDDDEEDSDVDLENGENHVSCMYDMMAPNHTNPACIASFFHPAKQH